MPHDLAILAGAGLGLVGVDHEIMRPAVRLLGHERPFEPGREAGAAAAAQPRGLHLVDDPVAALLQHRLGAVPGAARPRAFEAPVVETVEIGENAVLVLEHHDFPLADESAAGGFGTGASRRFAAVPGVLASASRSAGCSPCPGAAARIEAGIGERGRTAQRRGQLPIDLRAGLDLLAAREIGEQRGEALRGEILVVIEIDLRDRRVHAGAETLDLDPRQLAVRGDVQLLADPVVAELDQLVRPAQHARRGAAELDMELSDRLQIEHGVEGRDFERADLRHAEKGRDVLDRLLRQPAAGLLLRAPQDRKDRGRLPAFRIFGDLVLGPIEVLGREGEALGLQRGLGEAANGHQRSTSPNTMSSEPRIADTSASMYPLQRKSIAWRCAKPGARIWHL